MTVFTLFGGICGNSFGMVQAQTLQEYAEEMDSPLEIQQMAGAWSRAANTEPEVTIGKTAKWLDIERGYAQIDLTEEDTSVYSNQGIDYLIILDRTRTMALNDLTFEGEPSNEVGSGNSPCLNRDHYYEYNGNKLDLYDYENGVIRGTDQMVTLPLDAKMYNRHKDASGNSIAVNYSNGCTDRLKIAKTTICGLIDKIAAGSSSQGVNNRVSYWSFAGIYWADRTGDLAKGIFDYAALTSDYAAVKAKVQETGSYAGTYYQNSMERAYEQLSKRAGQYKDRPSKVIFISDGKCADDHEDVIYWNEKLRAIPNCTVYTLAVGMPVNSEGGVFLKSLSSNEDKTTFAAFTTNLNSSNPAFANTLTSIEEAKVEVKAVNKVLKDKINTEYWEFTEVLSADGKASVTDGVLTWNVPEGSGKTYFCRLKVRLRDKYRFLLSDTSYPTNLDTEQEKGCSMTYTISGGISHGQERKVEKETPYLKYGVLQVLGAKQFSVSDSEPERLTLKLNRSLGGSNVQTMDTRSVSEADGWKYLFKVRKMIDEEDLPLVLYTNEGQRWEYTLEEDCDFYSKIREKTEEKNGVLQVTICNEPYKVRVRMKKEDAETGTGLSGARFAVYEYSSAANNYVPYCGTEASAKGGAPVILKDCGSGVYESSSWLYYTGDNQGRFRLMEEKAPEGYVGDYVKDISGEKNRYEIAVTKENTGTTIEQDLNGNPLTVKNERVKGKIFVYKKDADSLLPAAHGKGVLFYEEEEKNAGYGLYHRGELLEEKRINGDGFLVFENLELGDYMIKELDNPPEGYLLDTTEYEVTLEYEGEAVPMVTEYLDVLEPVKKQAQKIFKIGDASDEEEYEWLTGAGFTVLPIASLGNNVLNMTDDEILAYVDENYRNKKTLTYEAMKELPGLTLYREGEAYTVGEITSGDGVYITPELPYGDYIIAETTVPEKKRPVRPFILHITKDEQDGEKTGDGQGTPLPAKVLRDREVLSNVRIIKTDAGTGEPLKQGEAAYVIRDVEGSWKDWYFTFASLKEKALYTLKYNGLVVEYDKSSGIYRGTYENPYVTEKTSLNGKTVIAASTKEGLPTGVYELEEVAAPEGYILQGAEGHIAVLEDAAAGTEKTAVNGTFYETAEEGMWDAAPSEPVRFSVGIQYGTYDTDTDCWWTEVVQENVPAIGKLSILAQREVYEKTEDGRMTGRTVWEPIKGACFVVTEGKETVGKLITNEEGKVWTGSENTGQGVPAGLSPGEYRITWEYEKEDGKTITEERTVMIAYQDDKTPVIYKDEIFRIPIERKSHREKEYTETIVPVTGDDNLFETALLLLGGSAAALAAVYVIRRRRNAQ